MIFCKRRRRKATHKIRFITQQQQQQQRQHSITILNHGCRTIIWIAQGEVQRCRVRRGWGNWTNAISSDETEQIHQKLTFVWVTTDCLSNFVLNPARFVTVRRRYFFLFLFFYSSRSKRLTLAYSPKTIKPTHLSLHHEQTIFPQWSPVWAWTSRTSPPSPK